MILSDFLTRFRKQNLTQFVILLLQLEMIAHKKNDSENQGVGDMDSRNFPPEYKDIIETLCKEIAFERVAFPGHTSTVQGEIDLLDARHKKLLADTDNTIYQGIYELVLPHIVLLRTKTPSPKGEIETLLTALIGTMSISIQNSERLTPETQKSVEQISSLFNCINEDYAQES